MTARKSKTVDVPDVPEVPEVSPEREALLAALTADKPNLEGVDIRDAIEAVGTLPTDSPASAFIASRGMGAVYAEIDRVATGSKTAAMPTAAKIVGEAYEAGVFTKVNGGREFSADAPMSQSAYARTLNLSPGYIIRLLRLSKVEAVGILPGSDEYTKVSSYGGATDFAWIDEVQPDEVESDEERVALVEKVRESDASRLAAIAAKREDSAKTAAALELAKSRKAELDTLDLKGEALAHLKSVADIAKQEELSDEDRAEIRAAIAATLDRWDAVIERASA